MLIFSNVFDLIYLIYIIPLILFIFQTIFMILLIIFQLKTKTSTLIKLCLILAKSDIHLTLDGQY